MFRIQLYLTQEQCVRLKDESRRRGASVAAIVRAAIDEHVERDGDLAETFGRRPGTGPAGSAAL